MKKMIKSKMIRTKVDKAGIRKKMGTRIKWKKELRKNNPKN